MTGSDRLAGLVLAAGAGERLWPLTRWAPKALCPVGNVPLVDHAIARLRSVTDAVAVNVHHGREAMLAHLAISGEGRERLHVSVERTPGLGTAGAVGLLRDWIDGRDCVVTNADAWLGGPPAQDLGWLLEDWDRERVRLSCVRDPARGDFGPLRYAGVALLPAAMASAIDAVPSGLYEVLWRGEMLSGRLDLVEWSGPFVDCGTVHDYLAANLTWSGGESVVAPGAHVEGRVDECVVWSGAVVPERVSFTRAVIGPGWAVHAR